MIVSERFDWPPTGATVNLERARCTWPAVVPIVTVQPGPYEPVPLDGRFAARGEVIEFDGAWIIEYLWEWKPGDLGERGLGQWRRTDYAPGSGLWLLVAIQPQEEESVGFQDWRATASLPDFVPDEWSQG